MRVILRATAGPAEGKCFWLREGQSLRFGRGEHSDHPFPSDGQMSGLHFQVSCDEQSVRVRDLKSTNGTLVNGQRIEEHELTDGEEITAGRSRFRVEIDRRPRTAIQVAPQFAVPASAAPVRSAAIAGNGDDSPRPPPVRESLQWLARRVPDSARHFYHGLTDEDAGVRRESAWAAAWTRQPWLLEYCRLAADEALPQDTTLFHLLAVLGKPADFERIAGLTRRLDLGAERWMLLGAFGHPAGVELLLAAMGDADPRAASAAGAAFTKITGIELPARDAPGATPSAAFTQTDATLDDLPTELPDSAAARRLWRDLKPRFADALRWCRGLPLHQRLDDAGWSRLDVASCVEICLREHYEGVRRWAPDRIARFPELTAAPTRSAARGS